MGGDWQGFAKPALEVLHFMGVMTGISLSLSLSLSPKAFSFYKRDDLEKLLEGTPLSLSPKAFSFYSRDDHRHLIREGSLSLS